MCLSPVVPFRKPHPQDGAPSVKPLGGGESPREQLTNRMATLFAMQRRASEVSQCCYVLCGAEGLWCDAIAGCS